MPKDKQDVESKKFTKAKKLLLQYPSKEDMPAYKIAKLSGLSDKTIQRLRNTLKKDVTFLEYTIKRDKVSTMKKKLMDKIKKDFTIKDLDTE